MTPTSKKAENKKAGSNKTLATSKTTRTKPTVSNNAGATKATTGKATTGIATTSKLTTTKASFGKKATKESASDKSTNSKATGKATTTKATTAKATTAKAATAKPATAKAAAATKKAGAGKTVEKSFRSRKKSKVPEVTLVSKSVAQSMMKSLCDLYPDADCELDFGSTFQLLISVILSAQTTDVQVNKVTPKLFERFPTAKTLAEGSLDEIKDLIKATGFFNAKATNIQRCAQALVERFSGEVPKTLDELTTLPGAGRKTANVVLGVAFDVPGWTVDTHVQRLSARLGLTRETDPYKIELDLQNTFPDKDWTKYSITLIWHGRRLCYARNPDCAHCPINNLCPSSEV